MLAGAKLQPPHADLVHDALPDMVRLANDESMSSVIRAAEVHYNLAALHPFGDGNGRKARLLMNFILLRDGYPLTYVDSAHRQEYISSLDRVPSGDLTSFSRLIANRVLHSLKMFVGEQYSSNQMTLLSSAHMGGAQNS